MKSINLKCIAKHLAAEYSGEDILITGVSTDTRTIEKGNLFVCIVGEKMNGHNFVSAAVSSGAAAIVASEEIDCSVPVIYVKNTVDALIEISAFYRSLFSPKIVGVTGSVGKTSTKEMIYAALSGSLNTVKTAGNQNNEIGLPHTLFKIDDSTEAAVIEMGMVQKGEIDVLTRAVRPQVAVITNIGVSHIENLKTRENILSAKLEIENGLSENGVMVLCGDNDLLATTKGKLSHRSVYYGINGDDLDVYADNICYGDGKTDFVIHQGNKAYSATIPTVGEHNVLNALAAFSVCDILGLDKEVSVKALENFENAGSRQKVYKTDGITVIEDCYNASPDSMKAALWVLKNIEAERKIAVLGDMLELGDISKESHVKVGLWAKETADLVFAFGPQAKNIKETVGENAYHFENRDLLISALKRELKRGDAVLFKGSRGMKLEEVIKGVLKGEEA